MSAPDPARRGGPVIPAGARFEGVLAWRGDVRVEGELAGSAVGLGCLEIAAEAQVRGPVDVDELVVAGSLEGDAVARRRIELRPGARVVGDLQAPVVAMADGCHLEGRLRICAASASQDPAADAPKGAAEPLPGPGRGPISP